MISNISGGYLHASNVWPPQMSVVFEGLGRCAEARALRKGPIRCAKILELATPRQYCKYPWCTSGLYCRARRDLTITEISDLFFSSLGSKFSILVSNKSVISLIVESA